MFQQASRRLVVLGKQDAETSQPIIICHKNYRFFVQKQLREIGIGFGAALLEPVGINTAPALTLALLHVIEQSHVPVLVA